MECKPVWCVIMPLIMPPTVIVVMFTSMIETASHVLSHFCWHAVRFLIESENTSKRSRRLKLAKMAKCWLDISMQTCQYKHLSNLIVSGLCYPVCWHQLFFSIVAPSSGLMCHTCFTIHNDHHKIAPFSTVLVSNRIKCSSGS